MNCSVPEFLVPLAELSVRLGSDIEMVQAAGGNTSVKHDGRLWIKASGTWLRDAFDKPVFVLLDLMRVREAVSGHPADIDAGVHTARLGDSPLLPSIETSLHALMPQRVVVHVHSINTVVHAMLRNGRKLAAGRLGDIPFLWIPYIRPGAPLTLLVREALAAQQTNVLILENHGLVVGAPDIAEAEALVREVERRLALPARTRADDHIDMARLEALAARHELAVPSAAEAHAIAFDDRALSLAGGAAYYPDHVVFLGQSPHPVLAETELGSWLKEHRARNEADPAFIVLPDIGVLVRKGLAPGGHELLRFFGMVLSRVPSQEAVKGLSPAEEDDLLNWDAEKYRQSLQAVI